MQRFTGHFGNKLLMLFGIVMAANVFYFLVIPHTRQPAPSFLLLQILFGSTGGLFGLGSVYGLLETFTVYTVEEGGISRRAWNGTARMRWQDLARLAASNDTDSTLVLTDERGEKLSVQRGLLGSKRALQLNAALEPHLTPVRARLLREMGTLNNVYHPRRGMTWASALLTVVVGLMLGFILMQPVKSGDAWAFAMVLVFAGGMELLVLHALVESYTNTLTLTQSGVTESSLFRSRQIFFDHATTVSTRTVRTKNGSYDLTTLEGDGQKIRITSYSADYTLLRDFIKAHVKSDAREQGIKVTLAVKEKEQKQAHILLPIFAGILLIFMGGGGLLLLRLGQTNLVRYRLLEMQGRVAPGRITRVHDQGPKGARYQVEYTYTQADGSQAQSASVVSWHAYQNARVGSPVTVTYVPGRSDMTEIPQDSDRHEAASNIRTGYTIIGLGSVTALLLAITPFLKNSRRASENM